MTLRVSTGFRQNLLNTTGFKETFGSNGGQINLYTGAQPASADDAVPNTSTLLLSITERGEPTSGLEFEDPVNGMISKTIDVWQGTGIANGVVGWFRLFVRTENASVASDTLARIDGSVAVSGGDMAISNTSLVTGAVQTLSTFTLALMAD